MKKNGLEIMAAAFVLGACMGGRPNSDNDAGRPGEPKPACRVIEPDEPGGGRRVVLRCSGEQVLATRQARRIHADNIRVSFTPGGEILQGEQIVRMAGSANGMSDDAACQHMFLGAVRKLQGLAKRQGGTGVSHIRNHLDKVSLPNGEFDCQAGTFHARVVIMADIVR